MSFADLPARISGLLREHGRLAVVLLDAFGMAFVRRHADHPLLRRLTIEPLASQFPSTTTAHLTTLSTGLPVAEHGLYEWRVYDPGLDAVVVPLRMGYAHDEREPLPLDPAELLPPERFLSGATVLQPAAIAHSPWSRASLAGARLEAYDDLRAGVGRLGERPGLTYLYWDGIDAAGHRYGPSSPEFDAACVAALDALLAVPPSTPLLVTADHGQVDVSAFDELDGIWPELVDHLRRDRAGRPLWPAGSARDCFLHVDDPETVVAELSARLGDRAEVRLAAELFPDAGPRLTARLADVCVLPAPGRMAWLAAFPTRERRFRGAHGGLAPDEAETWLGLLGS
jgi:predicted AlkP superfamily pyrophosphatase or phosphodiesterase